MDLLCHVVGVLIALTVASAGTIDPSVYRAIQELGLARKDNQTMLRNELGDVFTKLAKVEELLARQATNLLTADEKVQVTAGPLSTYIRWGRSTCDGEGTILLYSGYVGGSSHDHTGGAANYLCLPKDPIYDDVDPGKGTFIYGSEYEVGDAVMARGQHDHDVPCAVCEAPRTTVLMVPARNACYDGWALEYKGYLMAGHHTHPSSTEFVCVDKEFESLDGGGEVNANGRLFYFVMGQCGSMRCPPYVQNSQLTCAVCTK